MRLNDLLCAAEQECGYGGELVMDRGNTKREILDAALELFSVQGFEATSISQIASAVGIRKASLYSHFENKQAILDTLVKAVFEHYGEHSIFAGVDWENAGAFQ